MAREAGPGTNTPGGARLRALRQAAGLSLHELAGQLDDAGLRIDAAHLPGRKWEEVWTTRGSVW